MPTYDYACKMCGYNFELFQGMLEKKLAVCPKCGGQLQRLIGAGAGIIFKGSGFYQTDYRSKDYVRRAKEEKKGASTAAPSKGKKKKKETAKVE